MSRIQVPVDYAVQNFYLYAGKPIYHKHKKLYNGSCPICREGSSWLKKRRLYYNPDKQWCYCHNCGWSGSIFNWLMVVTGKDVKQLTQDITNNEYSADMLIQDKQEEVSIDVPDLPIDSIDLFDTQQVKHYSHEKAVQTALRYIKERRLDTAVNRPDSYFLSLKDRVHKNRLIIPFYDHNNKIIFYQSRTIDGNYGIAKYMSKLGGQKSLYNIHKVSSDIDSVFIFEGPINASFVQNGLAVTGIQTDSDHELTSLQQQQLQSLLTYDKIWVLDSQWVDKASWLKTQKLIEKDEKVFIWPEMLGTRYKDFNDITIDRKRDDISPSFIKKHAYQGTRAKVEFLKLKKLFKSVTP